MLAVAERRVDAAAIADYLTAVPARRNAAASFGVHFWVFEHTEDRGRFIEFVEGASEGDVRAAAAGSELSVDSLTLWREVQGG
jgi:hypothetical protein